jgi:malonyl-CoA O-methyltransferase
MIDLHEKIFDKNHLKRNFDSAAVTYESHSVLQRYTSDEILDRLTVMNINPRLMMDLGSGTGLVASGLSELYPKAIVCQVDVSLNMLKTARDKKKTKRKHKQFLCADAESLPFISDTFDLVVSNLMLQWGEDCQKIFSDVHSILKPGGAFMFATLGPSTLHELKDSWAEVDEHRHVNNFIDMHILGEMLVSVGMSDPVMESDTAVMYYNSVFEIMQHLKCLGAHNVNYGRRKTLTGKTKIKAMEAAYEAFRNTKGLPSSYEVVYGHAWKPTTGSMTAQTKPHTFSLASLKETLSKISNK